MHITVDNKTSLRLAGPEDAKSFYPLIERNAPYLRQWLPWLDNSSLEITHAHFEMMRNAFTEQKAAGFIIVHEDKEIGFAGFNNVDHTLKVGTIGYWISEDAQGKGIMTNVVKALINFGFTEWKLHKIEIRCAPGNTRSQRIPEKLGFTREGIIRDAQYLYDHYENLILYGLLENEFVK